jgi:hypothetical protein
LLLTLSFPTQNQISLISSLHTSSDVSSGQIKPEFRARRWENAEDRKSFDLSSSWGMRGGTDGGSAAKCGNSASWAEDMMERTLRCVFCHATQLVTCDVQVVK